MLFLFALMPLAMAMPFDIMSAADPQVLATYDDSFARTQMLAMSAAAYSGDPGQCVRNILGGTMKRQVTVKCDGFNGDTCSGFTAVSPKDKAIIISFRGTSGFLQILEEADYTLFKKMDKFIGGGNVDYYFNEAFMKIWNSGMKDDFLTLLQQNPGYEIWATGHSLGGSMVSIAASYIVATGIAPANKIKLVTYGQPRTGDSTFAAMHDKLFSYTFRVTHSHDMVAHIPLKAEGYLHHKSEAFYQKEDMGRSAKYHVCNGDEDKDCSDGNFTDLSINDHLHYFDKDVSGWGDSGCQ